MTILKADSCSIGRKSGKIWTGQTLLQPVSFKSARSWNKGLSRWRIGAPKPVRAVVQACATNKLAVAIPCHRVVRNGGALARYRWGVARKRTFLEKESSNQALENGR